MLVAVVTYLIDCALGWKIKRAIQQNEAYTIRLFNERIETLTKQVESAQMVRDLRHEDQLKTILKALAHLQNDKGNENESTN